LSWRGVLVYWVLAAVAAGQLAVTLRNRQTPAEANVQVTAPIIETPAAAIDGIRIERGDDVREFRIESGRWRAENPDQAVSSDLIAALIDTLTTIPPVEILEAGTADPATYGLAPPQTVVRMVSGGEPLATVEMGNRNPTRTAVYAHRADVGQSYLLGLNAQYYLDLIFERAAAAPVAPPAG
jgi:hypothetical protein